MKRFPCIFSLFFILLSVKALAQLNASFTANPISGCAPLTVNFTDQSTGNPTTWFWSLGYNNTTSSQQNPSIIYAVPGTYSVTLIVSDGSSSDTLFLPDYISVFPDPVAEFTLSPDSGCAPLSVSFTDTSTPGSGSITDWIWDFGDGSADTLQNPVHTYTDSGKYNITLAVTDVNGCKNSITKSQFIQVSQSPVASFQANPNIACTPPLTAYFTNNSTGSSSLSYFWDFGDGDTSTQQDPTHNYLQAGVYDVSLITTNSIGCSDTLLLQDYISLTDLTADFSFEVSGCGPATVTFSDASSPSPNVWNWDFGDGNTSIQQDPVHVYAAPGTYPVRLYAENAASCNDSITLNVTVNPPPIADFSTTDTYYCEVPYTANFTNTSTGVVAAFWDFGDGSISNAGSPAHTYAAAGSYDVSLVVMNADSCFDTLVRQNYINIELPQVNFSADTLQGCAPFEVNFTDTSTSNEPITGWLWDFGDGNTSNQQNPTHLFNQSDSFNVTLTVTNSLGCQNSFTANDYIMAGTKRNPNFIGIPDTACADSAIQFSNLTVCDECEWYWEFGDGSNSTARTPIHMYSDIGPMDVMLVAINNGCPDTLVLQDYIYIYPPIAEFTPTLNCGNKFEVTFTDQSVGADTWLWDFGDGDTSTQQNPTHTYNSIGTYTVILYVTNVSSGCDAVKGVQIQIAEPIAGFTSDTTIGCVPLTISFSDTSQDAVAWQWNFGDGGASGLQNPLHTYTTPGVYDVSLDITDVNGCQSTISKPAYITVLGPITEFDADTTFGCLPFTANFNDSTFAADGINSWKWFFGDGDSSTTQNPVHKYDSTGFYTVSLTVVDGNNCPVTRTKTNYIQVNNPIPDFTVLDSLTCPGKAVRFQDQSSGSGLTYLWDFGDGNTSTQQNPTHTYNSENFYTISLTVTDQYGCDSTISKVNAVDANYPVADFGGAPISTNCPPMLTFFKDSSSGAVSWLWNFGDGSFSNLKNPAHLYSKPGLYDVSLSITNNVGCTDTVVKTQYINVGGPSGTFTFNPDSGCAPLKVDFQANAVNTQSYSWDFADGNTGSGVTTSHTYTTAGNFSPFLVLEDAFGCKVTILPTDVITVNYIATTAGPDTIICPGEGPIQLYSSGGITYSWSPDPSLSATSIPNPIASPVNTTTYRVSITDSNGCTAPNTATVTIDTVIANAGNDTAICIGSTFQLNATGGTSYTWSPATGLSNPNIANPVVNISTTSTYTLTVTDGICSDEDTIVINVNPLPNVSAGNDQTICERDSIQLDATGNGTFAWSPTNSLSDSATQNPYASPQTTTTYTVTLTDSNGCQRSDSVVINVKPLPASTAGPKTAVCPGSTVQLFALGGVSYKWSPTNSLNNPFISNPQATPARSTTYLVSVTGANNCTAIDTAIVNINAGFVNAGPDTAICMGDTAQLHASGALTYNWMPNTYVSKGNIPNPYAYPPSTTTYYLTATDTLGCTDADTLILTVNELPPANAGKDTTICAFDRISLNASGGISYRWSPGGSLSDSTIPNPSLSISTSAEYFVTVRDNNGCENSDKVHIIVLPLPPYTLSEDTAICPGESVMLQVQGGYYSVWSSPDDSTYNTSSRIPTVKPKVTTTYSVTITGNYNCQDSDKVTITVYPQPTVLLDPSTITIIKGQLTTLYPQVTGNNLTYFWEPYIEVSNPLILNPQVAPEKNTQFILTVTSSDGCTASDTINFNVIDEAAMIVPTAFSPDGNGINDRIYAYEVGMEEKEFLIFNRWGEVVFRTNDFSIGWDGTYKGVPQEVETYTYLLRGTTVLGNELIEKGNISLIR